MASARPHWLLVALSTAGAPASTRVTAWRRLRSLGALYVQQSVCLLPANKGTRAGVEGLAARVRDEGGSVRIVEITVTNADEHTALVAELQEARDTEYGEVLERFGAFFAELELETSRGRTTYEELEESEADLDRFRAWVAKIDARDYFGAPRGEAAREELARAEHALATFAALTMDAEDVGAQPQALGQRRPSRPELKPVRGAGRT